MKKPLSIVLASMMTLAVMIAGGCANGGAATQTAAPEKTAAPKETPPPVSYPTKTIELIVPFAAGGGTDAVGRVLAESLKSILKQDVVVVNKTGGSGAVGMQEGLNSKPDGYTLTMVTREVTSLPLLGLAPFKTLDFKYVGNINKDPAVLVVSSDSKYKTYDDLVTALKATPGKLKFAASAVPNYYAIQFGQAAKVNFITIPFQGAAPAIIEILGGRADFGLYNPGEVKAQVEAGKLIPLAVMDDKQFPGFTNVPTMKEKGADAVSGTYRGIAVPKETPDQIVKVLEDAMAKAAQDPKLMDFMNKQFLGIGYMNAVDFKKFIEEDMKILQPIVEISKTQK
ncbi:MULTISPECIES: tripartite tricarboxylate transporter substrate binding protein [unclassified Paenibacillus]|uniref:tripartite tricarboxylate transporter substrate binding protein n=1 Tax=unclassified Paenibacillus TaxID=185978 RepID=UPI001AE6DDF2|nr:MULTISPECIES: tripartite tricarboxylate transporter substrate binding protein [unclassified Paenibacillus]MBP1154900.1 tripartite-type tricarboxylate transporter receptor subunit TctC [Paenibacillus sp. PvP091]MBP1169716.1 tripartite-type tricarboxylate transporter receptor subunit TctC [Paenibacillus sp. PvR098]MBP2440744.1 tripartite-type tricarboxylate transporter receptor subunit TctC [Paenibacillus sp. PvP052]